MAVAKHRATNRFSAAYKSIVLLLQNLFDNSPGVIGDDLSRVQFLVLKTSLNKGIRRHERVPSENLIRLK